MIKPYFSVIIPVYNEEKNLRPLLEKLQTVLFQLKKPWEVIFVNDGSNDQSEEVLRELKSEQSRVKIISFTRNFGQTAAFSAGFDSARGKILITLDSDLQNDPKDIPRLLKLMEKEKAEVVCGWRKDRQDPFFRAIVSRLANKIINQATSFQLHDLGCSLRVYERPALSHLQLYGEMHRFIPILAAARGAKVIEMPVTHHPRVFGKSKYGLGRTFKVLLDLVTLKFLIGFQTKPIYMFGFIGLVFIFLSFAAGLWVVVRRLFFGGIWVSPMLFIMTILFNIGIVCVLLGLLAEIQIRTWYEGSGKKAYVIKKFKS